MAIIVNCGKEGQNGGAKIRFVGDVKVDVRQPEDARITNVFIHEEPEIAEEISKALVAATVGSIELLSTDGDSYSQIRLMVGTDEDGDPELESVKAWEFENPVNINQKVITMAKVVEPVKVAVPYRKDFSGNGKTYSVHTLTDSWFAESEGE